MIAGVGHPKGFKNIEPEDVANAVARLIVSPKPRVVIPKSFGILALSGRRLMPQRVYESLERVLGTERVFMADVDVEQRKDYAKWTGTF